MNFKITLPLPPPTNRIYRSGYSKIKGRSFLYKSDEAKAWMDEVGYLIKAKCHKPTKEPVGVIVYWFFKIEADIDGRLKPLLDVLQGLVIENDSQIIELHVYKKIGELRPEVNIEILTI